DRTWQTDIELKLMAAIRFCRLTIPIMQKRGGGVIVNVTTVGGKAPAPRAVPTAVTRAAGINLTKGLAHEYASAGIRVNTICLGLVKSEQWERRAKGGDVEAVYREAAKRVPLGRMGEAEEFGDLVAFLVSARAASPAATTSRRSRSSSMTPGRERAWARGCSPSCFARPPRTGSRASAPSRSPTTAGCSACSRATPT